jgi:excisionase family DNA binding protein
MDYQTIDLRLQSIEQAVKMNKRLLSFAEGCKFLGISESYGYKLTMNNILPFSKPNGKTIFFDRDKLEQWALSNAMPGSDERAIEAATYLTTHQSKRRRK